MRRYVRKLLYVAIEFNFYNSCWTFFSVQFVFVVRCLVGCSLEFFVCLLWEKSKAKSNLTCIGQSHCFTLDLLFALTVSGSALYCCVLVN